MPMTSIGQILGTAGRIGRLAYLGWNFGISVLLAAIILLALALLPLGGFATTLGWVLLGLALLIFALSYVAVVGRRLHDVGLSSLHVVWLLPLMLLAGWYGQFGAGDDAERIAAALLATALHGWLLLMPGERGANAHGPGTDARRR